MPSYQFKCTNCGKDENILMKMSEYTDKQYCKVCGEKLERKIEDMVSNYVAKCDGFYGKTTY